MSQKKSFIECYQQNRKMKTWSSFRGQWVNTSRWISFWNSLDDILDGNKLYDWYYTSIWTPIWNFFYDAPRTYFRTRKEEKERGKNGYSHCDVYDIKWYIKELLYKMLKDFLIDEYGKDPVDWTQRNCQTHDKVLYNDIKEYINAYDDLIHLYDEDYGTTQVAIALFRQKERQAEYRLKASMMKIMSEHLEKLWI